MMKVKVSLVWHSAKTVSAFWSEYREGRGGAGPRGRRMSVEVEYMCDCLELIECDCYLFVYALLICVIRRNRQMYCQYRTFRKRFESKTNHSPLCL